MTPSEGPSGGKFAGGADELVALDPEHPGFRDQGYRERRNAIARLALDYREGEPVPHAPYSEEEHGVWRVVWAQLAPAHDRYAASFYRACAARLPLDRTRIPQLADVNAALGHHGGVRMLPVAGLVSARTFLSYLGRDVFLSTQYIRHHSRPFYTPEPDVVHELVGHAATFVDDRIIDLNRAFGEAMARADEARAEAIANVYWYTLEFGVVREEGQRKAVGAGLLSSFGELERFERESEIVPFDLDRVAVTSYDPTGYQRLLFEAESLEVMIRATLRFLELR